MGALLAGSGSVGGRFSDWGQVLVHSGDDIPSGEGFGSLASEFCCTFGHAGGAARRAAG